MLEPALSKSRSPYRKYPKVVRAEIARTANIYLVPSLKIPRTTAQYWVQRRDREVTPEHMDSLYREQNEALKKELERERAVLLEGDSPKNSPYIFFDQK